MHGNEKTGSVEPKLNNLVETMISAGPEPSMCSTMGLRMPMGRPILVMQSIKFSKILLAGVETQSGEFFKFSHSGFRVPEVVDCTGCQVWISMCFLLYFEQAGTAMAFLLNSKP